MCGIAGFFTNKNLTQEQKEEVFEITSRMFVETQSRGTDASGFSYINKFGKLTTIKGPITAQKMVQEQKFLTLKQDLPTTAIFHCRAMTVGSQLDNFNNHPLVSSKLIALIHNGTIGNHLALKKKHELQPKGAVDSEVIPMLIHKHLMELAENNLSKITPDKMVQSINIASKQLEGGFSCAAINEKTPDVLYLFNHTNPMVLAYCKELDTIFFASTRDIIESSIKAVGTTTKFGIFNIPKYIADYGSVDNDTIVVLGRDKKNPSNPDLLVAGFELKANSKFRTYDSTKGRYQDNDYDVPAPEKPVQKAILYGGTTTKKSAEKEDWEVARAAGACDYMC